MIDTTEQSAGNRPSRHLRTCPFCGGSLNRRYDDISDRLETTSERFSVSECAGCRAGALNPAPVGDVSDFYPDLYLSAEAGPGRDGGGFDLERWYRYDQYDFDFRLLERTTGVSIGETVSYLDLGCGSGERVVYARERGCARTLGVDKFNFAKPTVRHRAEIVNAEILEFVPEEKFAAVSLFHVLEHLEDPAGVLGHVRDRLLDPDGHLIIQVPNYGSLERRWFGARWFGLDAPRHYWHFNPEAVSRLLGAQGFRVDAVFQRNAALHPVSIAPSLIRDVDVQRIWARHSRGVRYRQRMTLLWAGLTALTMPLGIIQSRCGRGSMLTVIASAR